MARKPAPTTAPEPITLRRDAMPDGSALIFILAPWPQVVLFTPSILADTTICEILTDEKTGKTSAQVTVENGSALYALAPVDVNDNQLGTLLEEDYEDAPAAPEQGAPAVETDPNAPVDPTNPNVPPADAPAPNDVPPTFIPPADLTPAEPVPVPEPEPVDPLVALTASIEAPGHAVGDEIQVDDNFNPEKAPGLYPIGIDKLGRIWRVEKRDDHYWLVLAGRLAT